VGTLGFSIVLPFLVYLVTRWGGNALIYGVVGATYSVFQLIGAPILGRWSDRFGRRKILLLSQLGTLASWALFVTAFALPTAPLARFDSGILGAFAVTLPLLVVFLARALDGLTGGNVSVANAYLADITPEDQRSANFGKMAVSSGLGFILGPAVAGLLAGTAAGELLPVLAALGVSVAATLLIVFRLPESRPCVLVQDPEHMNVHKVLGPDLKPCIETKTASPPFRELVTIPRVGLFLLVNFLVMLGFNFFYIAFPVYAAGDLGWSVRETGVFFSVLSLAMVVVQGPILSRAARRWSDTRLILAGSLILAASFLFFVPQRVPVIYTGVVLLALGNGIMWPSVVSALSKAAGSRYQGAVQGLAGSIGAVASILGLLAGGLFFGLLGPRIFILSAMMILGVFLLSLRLVAEGSGRGKA
jgi:MFS family permease